MMTTKTTTTGTTTTTTTTTSTTTTTTTKKSRLAEYYTQQLAEYKKGKLDFDTPAEAEPTEVTPAEAETTTGALPAPAETPTTGALPAPVETATETAETTTEAITELQKMQAAHEEAVDFCVNIDTEEFCEMIRFAQHFGNKFPRYVVEIRDVVNADDVYKDAVNRICKPLGEEVCRKAIKLVDSKKILDLAEYLKYVKTIVEEWGEV